MTAWCKACLRAPPLELALSLVLGKHQFSAARLSAWTAEGWRTGRILGRQGKRHSRVERQLEGKEEAWWGREGKGSAELRTGLLLFFIVSHFVLGEIVEF